MLNTYEDGNKIYLTEDEGNVCNIVAEMSTSEAKSLVQDLISSIERAATKKQIRRPRETEIRNCYQCGREFKPVKSYQTICPACQRATELAMMRRNKL